MTPEGEDLDCMTCGVKVPGSHPMPIRGHAFWHPNGEHIGFMALNEHGRYLKLSNRPGIGANHDLYLMHVTSKKVLQVTDYPAQWALLHPEFSHDGETLYWNEEWSCDRPRSACKAPSLLHGCCCTFTWRNLWRPGEEGMLLRIKTAKVVISDSEISVRETKIVHVNHGSKRMLEGSGFTPDDSRFVFESVDISESNGRALCANIYTSDLQGSPASFRRLTNTPLAHWENCEYSPSATKIICQSGPLVGFWFYRADLVMIDADGGNARRLTDFHSPGYDGYNGKIRIAGDGSWHPDGTRYVFHQFDGTVNSELTNYPRNFCDGRDVEEFVELLRWQGDHRMESQPNIYLLTFAGPCGAADTSK